jgi:hypothetical protein
MLTCGWLGGVVSTLLIRHALDGRRPLDPALLPTSVAVPIAALALPASPEYSPYAPKKVLPKPTQRRDALLNVWAAAKQERSPSWTIPAPGHGAHQGGGREIREREHGSPAAPQSAVVSPRPPVLNGIARDGVKGARTVEGASEPEVRRPPLPTQQPQQPPARSAAALLPSIAWGQPHGGKGVTLTQEVRAQSAAENGHGAQAPRRRAP